MLSIWTSLKICHLVEFKLTKKICILDCLVKGLTHSHTITPFDAPGKQAFENIVGKGKIARNKQFLLFPHCFLPVWITSSIFVKFKIVVCKLFQFGRVYNLSSGNGFNRC